MKKFRFREWQVYNDGQDIFSDILKIIKKLPKEYRFDIGSQLLRCTLSIVLNIAEGSGKSSDKELNRFIEIALGSVYEVVACIDTLERNALITGHEATGLRDRLENISNQLGGFKRRILRRAP